MTTSEVVSRNRGWTMATATNGKSKETSPLVAQVTAEVRKGIRLHALLEDIAQEELAGRILTDFVNANPVQVVKG